MKKATEHDVMYIPAAQLRNRYGGVSDMWIWRRLNDPEAAFPQPVYFGRQRFWKLSEIEGWERAEAAKSCAKTASVS